MRIVRDIADAVPGPGAAVAIGTFDGVHVGHRALIGSARDAAKAQDLELAVVTWDRHPLQTLRPDDVPPQLTSPDRKLELLDEAGVDATVVVRFDRSFSRWSPERFVDEVLVRGLRAKAVRVGEGWRFGHRGAGDTDLLAKLGVEHGFEAEAVSLERAGADVVSSTLVRRAVAEGDLALAADLLARPYDIDGLVVRGDGRGATLGYPTANLEIDPALARPARGVYSGRVEVTGERYRAAVNVGKNPTFGGETIRVEAYILDFVRDIYGETIRVEFWRRLRDELRFDSVDALIAQMDDDVERTRAEVPL